MDEGQVSELQRQTLAHVQRAQADGVSLSAYARAQGIEVRQMYDAMVQLRKRGLLPKSSSKARRKFVTVKIAVPMGRAAAVCRVLMSAGVTIECAQWPPRSWLDQLSGPPDAAT